jgi:cytochrome bd-type quinol oxidase subunit 2
VFMMIGVGLCIPVIFTYQTFAYWVFRGKLSTGKEVAGK